MALKREGIPRTIGTQMKGRRTRDREETPRATRTIPVLTLPIDQSTCNQAQGETVKTTTVPAIKRTNGMTENLRESSLITSVICARSQATTLRAARRGGTRRTRRSDVKKPKSSQLKQRLVISSVLDLVPTQTLDQALKSLKLQVIQTIR